MSLELSEVLFIGKGHHKAVYKHPANENLCIKIPFALPDVDITKELAYRKALSRRKKKLSLLTEYLGTVETNLGTGYVFERIVDYDGSASTLWKSVLEGKIPVRETFGVSALDLLMKFRDVMLAEKVVVSDVDAANFMIMRTSADSFVFKVVDNIGTPVFLPLAYYIDFIAEKRIQRYWNRWIHGVRQDYADFLTSAEWSLCSTPPPENYCEKL